MAFGGLSNPRFCVLLSPALTLLTAFIQTNSLFGLRRLGRSNDRAQESSLPADALAKLDIPTIVFHGDADINVALAHAQSVAAAVPQATLKIFEGGDHFFYLPFREAFTQSLSAFLTEHRRS